MHELLKTFRSVTAIDTPAKTAQLQHAAAPRMAPSAFIPEAEAVAAPAGTDAMRERPCSGPGQPQSTLPFSPTPTTTTLQAPTLTAEQLISFMAEAEVAASAVLHAAFSGPLEPSLPHARPAPIGLRARALSIDHQGAGDPTAERRLPTAEVAATPELIPAPESLVAVGDTRRRRTAKRLPARLPKQGLKAAAVGATLVCCGAASIAFVAQGVAGIAPDASTSVIAPLFPNPAPRLETRPRPSAPPPEIKLAALPPTASPTTATTSDLTLPPGAAGPDASRPSAPRSMEASLRDKAIAAAVAEPPAQPDIRLNEKLLPQLVKQPAIAMRPGSASDSTAHESAPPPNKEADAPPVIEYAAREVGPASPAVPRDAASTAKPKPAAKGRQPGKAVAANLAPLLPLQATPPAATPAHPPVAGEARNPAITYATVLGLRIPVNAIDTDRTWTSTFFDNPGH